MYEALSHYATFIWLLPRVFVHEIEYSPQRDSQEFCESNQHHTKNTVSIIRERCWPLHF